METLFIVMSFVGGNEDGLVSGITFELVAETFRIGRIQVETLDLAEHREDGENGQALKQTC